MGDGVLQAELASIQCICFCYHCEFASPTEQFSTNLSVLLFVVSVYMYKSIQWQSLYPSEMVSCTEALLWAVWGPLTT